MCMDLLDPSVTVTSTAEGMELDELRVALIDACACVAAAQARIAQAMSVFRARGGDQADSGFSSFGQWASVDLGLSSRAATNLADAGDALAERPTLRAAWETGSLSASKAMCAINVSEPASEADWCELAREASATQLSRIAAAYRRCEDDDANRGRDAEEREAACGAWWHSRDDGLEELLAVLTPDDAAVERAGLETQLEMQWRASSDHTDPAASGDTDQPAPSAPRPTAARRADALVALAETAQAAGPIPIVRGEHTEVVLHVDEAFLTGRVDTGECRLTNGNSVALQDARRLACDARIRALVKGADGSTVDLGRSQRLVSDKQRRLLTARDHGCRFPGCGNTRYVDAHHVHYWTDGGPTDMDNLILLCNRHHRLLHHDVFSIHADGNGQFGFRNRSDQPIRPPDIPPDRPAHHRCHDVPGNPRARSGGDPHYSIDLAVTAMAAAG